MQSISRLKSPLPRCAAGLLFTVFLFSTCKPKSYEVIGTIHVIGAAVSIREEPSTSSDQATSLRRGDSLPVFGLSVPNKTKDAATAWYHVRIKGRTYGYISHNDEQVRKVVTVFKKADELRDWGALVEQEKTPIRMQPNSDSKVVANLKKGETIRLLGVSTLELAPGSPLWVKL